MVLKNQYVSLERKPSAWKPTDHGACTCEAEPKGNQLAVNIMGAEDLSSKAAQGTRSSLGAEME
jgi:hypothetical protein